jgi:hypothetical protein
VREIFRANRPTVSGPAILVETIAFEFAHDGHHEHHEHDEAVEATSALAGLVAPSEVTRETSVSEPVAEDMLVAMPTRGVAPAGAAAAKRALQALAADRVFAEEEESLPMHDSTYFELLRERLGIRLSASPAQILAAALNA